MMSKGGPDFSRVDIQIFGMAWSTKQRWGSGKPDEEKRPAGSRHRQAVYCARFTWDKEQR